MNTDRHRYVEKISNPANRPKLSFHSDKQLNTSVY